MNAAMDLEILTARNAGEYLELAVRLLGSEAGQRKLSTIRRYLACSSYPDENLSFASKSAWSLLTVWRRAGECRWSAPR
eukprot:3439665-Rhodomonas_salina.1